MKYTRVLALLAVLLVAALPVEAQEPARVRIGYFAFNPIEYDTYINGALASFSAGWAYSGLGTTNPTLPFMHQAYATPYLDAAATTISIAIVPKGEPLESRIMGPVSMELTPGHVYSFAFVGRVEANNLDLLMIDETEVLDKVDLESSYLNILVHNIAGAPPLTLAANSEMRAESLNYGRASVEAWPFEGATLLLSTTGDPPQTLFDWQGFGEFRVSSLAAVTGSYPGEAGKDLFWDINERYPGIITVDAGLAAAVGTTLQADLDAATHRTAHALQLDADGVVSISVHATGPRSEDSIYYGVEGLENFDPAVYVYDAAGSLLYWNDEQSLEDDVEGNFDPLLESISLRAGDYVIEVGGHADLVAGPYELRVERAAPR